MVVDIPYETPFRLVYPHIDDDTPGFHHGTP